MQRNGFEMLDVVGSVRPAPLCVHQCEAACGPWWFGFSWLKALWIKSPRAQLCRMPGTQLQATGLEVLRL